jgi:hypothetical protein
MNLHSRELRSYTGSSSYIEARLHFPVDHFSTEKLPYVAAVPVANIVTPQRGLQTCGR